MAEAVHAVTDIADNTTAISLNILSSLLPSREEWIPR
jgi:hypothetical protein